MYAVLGAVVIISIVALVLMLPIRFFQEIDDKAHSQIVDENDSVIEVSVEDMDKHFDRSAGRYCEHCGIHGSHHTDRHNEFAIATFAN